MIKLGLCISYNKLERIDYGPVQPNIDYTVWNRTPVPLTIDNSAVILGAIDSFDHDQGTLFRIGASHDISLMLLQKRQNDSEEQKKEVIEKPANSSQNWKY